MIVLNTTSPNFSENALLSLEHFLRLAFDSFVWILLAFVFLLFMSFLYERVPIVNKALSFIVEKCLGTLMVCVWLMGFTVYCIGSHSVVEDQGNFFSVAPMALIHATGMFLSLSDISAIREVCQKDVIYMALFNMSHFLAVVLCLVFIIKRFEYSLVAKFRLWLFSKIPAMDPQKVYVFWDINEDSCNLADSILNHDEGRKKGKGLDNSLYEKFRRLLGKLFIYRNGELDRVVIFVKTYSSDDMNDVKAGLSKVFNVVPMTNKEYDLISELGKKCFYVSTARLLSRLNLKDEPARMDILKDRMELNSISKILNRSNVEEINMFFLGDNHDANIAATINILDDATVQSKVTNIYCKARKNAKTHWMTTYEYMHKEEQTKINVVDPSYLSVVQLKNTSDCHPVNYVKIDKETGYVTSSFNSLVIGFGATGYEAMKFLYEYGAFVNAADMKSDFHCTVIDENMERLEGFFNIHTPALKKGEEIELLSLAINSEEYWNKIKEIMPTLNYVVFSLGGNEMTLNAVAYFCKMAAKWRDKGKDRGKDKDRGKEDQLRIFVRSYNNDTYNQLKKMCDEINIAYEEAHKIHVEPFGSSQDLYQYNNIVESDILAKAKRYNYYYSESHPDSKRVHRGSTHDSEYEKCWNKTLGIEDGEGLIEYDIEELQEIKRKREICISNYLHAITKEIICTKCKNIPKEILLERLCQIEHERWVAYMKINGWNRLEHSDEKQHALGDKVHKLHSDICPWNEVNIERKKRIKRLVQVVMEEKGFTS